MNRLLQSADRQRDVAPNGRSRLGPEDDLHADEAGKVGDQLVVTSRQVLKTNEPPRSVTAFCELPFPTCVSLTDAPGNRPPNCRRARLRSCRLCLRLAAGVAACGARGALDGVAVRPDSTGSVPDGTVVRRAAVDTSVLPDRLTTPTDTATAAITATVVARMKGQWFTIDARVEHGTDPPFEHRVMGDGDGRGPGMAVLRGLARDVEQMGRVLRAADA